MSMRTIVVPAAGMGTRFLPATKTVPKEVLPVVNTPGIELIAEEAAAMGAQRLVVVVSPQKREVIAHFEEFNELRDLLLERGKLDQSMKVSRAAEVIDIVAVTQAAPLGLGHAVGCAGPALSADDEVVAVMLPDDLVLPTGVMDKMVAVREALGGSVLCGFNVSAEEVSSYGVFEAVDLPASEEAKLEGLKVKRVNRMVEKPGVEETPSTLAAIGRYLLDRAVFDALRRIQPGSGEELQLTDAIELMISEGHPVHVVVHEGTRHDLGNPGGYIPANVEIGLRDEKYGPVLYPAIRKVIEEFESETAEKPGL